MAITTATFSYRSIAIAGTKLTSQESLFGGEFVKFIELFTLLLWDVRETGTTVSLRGLIPEMSLVRICETLENSEIPRRQLQEFKKWCPQNLEH